MQAQRLFDRQAQRVDGIDVGQGAKTRDEDRPILPGGFGGAGDCHGECGADGAGANADAASPAPYAPRSTSTAAASARSMPIRRTASTRSSSLMAF